MADLKDVVMAVRLQKLQFIQALGDVKAGVVQVGMAMLREPSIH